MVRSEKYKHSINTDCHKHTQSGFAFQIFKRKTKGFRKTRQFYINPSLIGLSITNEVQVNFRLGKPQKRPKLIHGPAHAFNEPSSFEIRITKAPANYYSRISVYISAKLKHGDRIIRRRH